LICLLATGCQQIDSTTTVTPTTLRVEISPTLRYLSPAIQACTLQENGLHIILEEKPASQMGKIGADVSLRWGDSEIQPSTWIYRLGSDRLIFAIHKNNPIKVLEIGQAAFLNKGGFSTWKEILEQYCPDCEGSEEFKSQPLEAWHYPPGEDISTEMAKIPAINQTGTLNRVYMAPNPSALAEAVSNNTAAVGWLPARWLNANLKEVALRNADPTQLILPVLASTVQEPTPVIREWLACIQSTFNN
jgi:hypothetical protein